MSVSRNIAPPSLPFPSLPPPSIPPPSLPLPLPPPSIPLPPSLPLLPFSPQVPSAMFYSYNNQLGPPYHVIVDTNFINFSIKNKLDIVQSMMDCLFAKCEWVWSSELLCQPQISVLFIVSQVYHVYQNV